MIRIFNNLLSKESSILKSSLNLINPSKSICLTSPKYYSTQIENVLSPELQQEAERVKNYNEKNNFKILDNTFAVVHLSGKQFKVIKGDVIMTDKLHINAGEHIVLDKVLLVGDQNSTTIGTPLVENVKVHAYVEEQTKSEHVIIFKHKRRKNYKRTTGFSPFATYVRIGDIISKN